MKAEEIKAKQMNDLQKECAIHDIDFSSIQKLLNSERLKKLSKRNQFIQQTINSEIEKSIDHENK